jgi:hypothetical protein
MEEERGAWGVYVGPSARHRVGAISMFSHSAYLTRPPRKLRHPLLSLQHYWWITSSSALFWCRRDEVIGLPCETFQTCNICQMGVPACRSINTQGTNIRSSRKRVVRLQMALRIGKIQGLTVAAQRNDAARKWPD